MTVQVKAQTSTTLEAVRMHLHAQHQPIAIMRTDCHVCHSEGLAPRSQVLITAGSREIQALLYQIDSDLLQVGQVALSEAAWIALEIDEGSHVQVRHPPVLNSLTSIRRRIHGHRLDYSELQDIVKDVVDGRYTDVVLSAFLTATAVLPMDSQETIHLTRAMVDVGKRLKWNQSIVVDKHCIGGLPGNRTTPIVVAIAAAHGLTMPKTSSRAITSPAGTADTMEVLTPVDLDIAKLQDVIEKEGGCLAWGGAMHLSPADDIFIRIEHELDIDTEGQLIASILSKKIAAGSTHVIIDIPIGSTAKIRTQEAAQQLASRLPETASAFGLFVRCLFTDGSQPIGRGIGPTLEARDVLAVLRRESHAPLDLRERAALVAGAVLEIGGVTPEGTGQQLALKTIDSGRAWEKFKSICLAQGGIREPGQAEYIEPLIASSSGRVVHIDNRKLSRAAKLAGAPERSLAGAHLNIRLGDEVLKGQVLLHIHAQTRAEMDYALAYIRDAGDIVKLEP